MLATIRTPRLCSAVGNAQRADITEEKRTMKSIFVVALLGLALVGCGNDCDDAVDHIEECGIADFPEVDTSECSGANECTAKCINDASCDELKGTDPDDTKLSD